MPTLSSQTIDIQVNGAEHAVPVGMSVAGLLAFLGIASDKVAVELDRSIIRKRDWDTALVPSGAQFEIVEFVGGG